MKQAPGKLVVTFLGTGKCLNDTIAADAFVKTIDQMGVKRAKDCNVQLGDGYLISEHPREDSYSPGQRELNGYWIMVKTNTWRKAEQLRELAKCLDIKIDVRIVPRH